MHNIEEQIHLRNIVTCLKELGDYAHYLSYERFQDDKELKQIILGNLNLAAQEAQSLYNKGYSAHGIQYLAGLCNIPENMPEDFAIYSLLQNDLDFLTDEMNAASNEYAEKEQKVLTHHMA